MIRDRDGREGVDATFLDLPHIVYRDDPMWIPEDAERAARLFSSANAWFGENEAVTFCAPGRARVAAFAGPRLVVDGEPAAFFGYWETVADSETDAALFARVTRWARERGARRLFGPIDFSTHFGYRLRLSAEHHALTFPGEPYNPPDYPARLERLGFSLRQQYVTQLGPTPDERMRAGAATHAALSAGYRLEAMTGERWLAELPRLHALVEESFAGNLAYVPIDFASFAAGYGQSVAAALCPHTSIAAYASSGELAGFLLVYPHYGELVVQGTAQRLPPRALRYDVHMPLLARTGSRPTAIAKTVGVAGAHKRRGVMNALAAAAISRGRDHYDNWIGALIRTDNPSRRFADGHASAERWYGLYAKSLDVGASS